MSGKEPTFTLTPEDLSPLFDHDNIRDKKSLILLKKFNGITGLCASLNTSPHYGIPISQESLSQREKIFGNNHPFIRERDSIFTVVWKAFHDFLLQILLGAALISLVFGTIQDPAAGWLEGVAIVIAVLIVVTVTATNNYMKDGQFIQLNLQTNLHNVITIRDNNESEIPAKDLLVGDLVCISPGEIFPVDGILVKGNGMKVDESAITGESKLVKKSAIRPGDDLHSDPFIVSGGKVSEGNGMMIVCAIGQNSVLEKHRLMSGQVDEEEETPLQEKLGIIATGLGKIGFLAGSLLTVILIVHLSIDAAAEDTWGSDQWGGVITSLILGVTILVVAIPEGLPLALTLAMAYSIFRMKDENIFVRHLKGCEIMGAITNILSDKTGTLTQNKMKVTKAVLYGQEFLDASSVNLPLEKKKIVIEAISRNSTAFMHKTKEKIELVGNRTEGALLELIDTWGYDYHMYRNSDFQKYQFAFTSDSKRMTTVYATENGIVVYCKGAAEKVLELSEFYYTSSGEKAELTHEKRVEIRHLINSYSSQSLRILGVAYKQSTMQSYNHQKVTQAQVENNLIFIGFFGIQDPLRPEARSSVIRVQQAGVCVRMVTGDKLETAVSIAIQANILSDSLSSEEIKDHVIKGKHFRERVGGLITLKNDEGIVTGFKVQNIEEFRKIVHKLAVIARCSPEDKLLLVIGLKELGEVVGVTGDGSNDAAALKQSDIGLAMMSGTQLAKESSDIILLDDNFESVVNSVKWGRNVYASVRKFLQFQITVSIVALTVSIIGGLSVEYTPLSAVQMLWVNLIMNSLAALALATEQPTDDLFNSKPYYRSEDMITNDMYITIISQAAYQFLILMTLLYSAPTLFDIEEGWGNDEWTAENGQHFTIFFHAFVMMQLFNEINCRKLSLSDINVFKNFFNNLVFVAIITLTFAAQLLFVEYGGEPISCVPLTFTMHLVCVGVGIIGLAYGILVRAGVSWYRKRSMLISTRREQLDIVEEKPLLNN